MDHIAYAREKGLARHGFRLHAPQPHPQHADQHEIPEECEQGKQVDEATAGKVGLRTAESMLSVEQAADRGPGNGGDLKNGRAPGHGVDKVLLWNQVRNQRGRGRPAESTAGADQKQHKVNRQNAMKPGSREPQQQRRARRLERIAQQHHAPAVKPVGDVAGRQQKKQSRQKQREPGVAQVERAMRDLVDLPGNRKRLRLGPDHNCAARRLVQAKIARLKRRDPALKTLSHVSLL